MIEKRTRPASAVLMSRPQGNAEHRNTETLKTYKKKAYTDTLYAGTVKLVGFRYHFGEKAIEGHRRP